MFATINGNISIRDDVSSPSSLRNQTALFHESTSFITTTALEQPCHKVSVQCNPVDGTNGFQILFIDFTCSKCKRQRCHVTGTFTEHLQINTKQSSQYFEQ